MNRTVALVAAFGAMIFTAGACGWLGPVDLSEMGKAEFGMRGGPKSLEARMCRLLADVELDEAELVQVRTSYAEVQADVADTKAELRALREEMHVYWTEETPDASAIVDTHAEIAPLRAQLFEVLVGFYTETIASLTPEQREQVRARLAECGEEQESGERGGGKGSCGGGGEGSCGGGEGTCEGEGKGKGSRGSGESAEGPGGELGLSADQIAQILSLRNELMSDIEPIKTELKEHKAEMCELWAADPPDAEAIVSEFDEMEPLRTEAVATMIAFRVEVYEILTPEQRAKMAEKIQSKHERENSKQSGACDFLKPGADADADGEPTPQGPEV